LSRLLLRDLPFTILSDFEELRLFRCSRFFFLSRLRLRCRDARFFLSPLRLRNPFALFLRLSFSRLRLRDRPRLRSFFPRLRLRLFLSLSILLLFDFSLPRLSPLRLLNSRCLRPSSFLLLLRLLLRRSRRLFLRPRLSLPSRVVASAPAPSFSRPPNWPST